MTFFDLTTENILQASQYFCRVKGLTVWDTTCPIIQWKWMVAQILKVPSEKSLFGMSDLSVCGTDEEAESYR